MKNLPGVESRGEVSQKAEEATVPIADFQQDNSDTLEQILSCNGKIKSITDELKYFSGRKKKIAENRISEFIKKRNVALDNLIGRITASAESGIIPSDEEILLTTEAEKGAAISEKKKGISEETDAVAKKSNFFKFLDENLNLSPYFCELIEGRLIERALEKREWEGELASRKSSAEALDQSQINQARERIGNLDESDSEGSSFDPEAEVQKIRREIFAAEMLSPQDKQDRLSELKERIATQKIGIAEINLYLEEKVTNNNQIDLAALKSFFEEKAAKYKLAPFQIERYNLLFGEVEKRIALMDYYGKRFENLSPKDTFKALFGFEPLGEVGIERRGLCSCVYCSSTSDYANIYAGKAQGEMKEGFKKRAESTGGCANVYTVLPELQGAIVAVNRSKEDDFHDEIAIHEEKHSLNNLAEIVQKLDKSWYLQARAYNQAADNEKLQMFFSNKSNYCNERAKDEALAYLKSGEHPVAILNRLEESKDEGGLYDYFRDENIYPIFQELKDIYSKEKLESMQDIFFKKYRSDLKGAVACFLELDDFGFSPEFTISIFQSEKLGNWPKVLKRLKQTVGFRNILKPTLENKLTEIGERMTELEDRLKLMRGSGIFARVSELFYTYDKATTASIQNTEQQLAVLRNKREYLIKSLELETKK